MGSLGNYLTFYYSSTPCGIVEEKGNWETLKKICKKGDERLKDAFIYTNALPCLERMLFSLVS